VSQIDLYPTLCELAGLDPPAHLQGTSLLPAVRREVTDVNDAIFAELTYHAAYDPQRAIRTWRYKYVRRFGERELTVLPNVDDSPSKELLLELGLARRRQPREELYDVMFDPGEAQNLVEDPDHQDVRDDLRDRLDEWMQATEDPLLDGFVPAPDGAAVNDPDGVSASEAPTFGPGVLR
jgi:arylsulfatase A-like enzyme